MGKAQKDINNQALELLETQALDHLGLVAAVTRDLGIVDKIDQRLPTTDKANVTMGQRVLAMILNGLGFTNDRLYLVPRFFQNKPVDKLIGPGIEAAHLNFEL
jgi:transposase